MNAFLSCYLGVIIGFCLGVWVGHDMGWPVLFMVGLSLIHWLSLFVTRNDGPYIPEGDW